MKKIPTMFERDWNGDRSRVIDKPHPDCAWVFAGEGVATQKLDGTCCMVRGGALFKRRELKPNQSAPVGFELQHYDAETGKAVGWVPVGDGPEDKWHREALAEMRSLDSVLGPAPDGTYELVGPNVQGNPERHQRHILVPHGAFKPEPQPPRTFAELREWLSTEDIEGIVFHHPDGRMAKIKLRDFGLARKVRA